MYKKQEKLLWPQNLAHHNTITDPTFSNNKAYCKKKKGGQGKREGFLYRGGSFIFCVNRYVKALVY